MNYLVGTGVRDAMIRALERPVLPNGGSTRGDVKRRYFDARNARVLAVGDGAGNGAARRLGEGQAWCENEEQRNGNTADGREVSWR